MAIDVLRHTDTKAGWTQILTGYEPEITGVYSNNRFGPIPPGYSVFERLENFFGRDNIVTMVFSGKRIHFDSTPPAKIPYKDADQLPPDDVSMYKTDTGGGALITEGGEKYWDVPAQPYHLMAKAVDVWENALGLNDDVTSPLLEAIRRHKNERFFIFALFNDIDYFGHEFGENSPQYNDAIVSADACLGRIVSTLRELGLYDDTRIYITADHGFDEGKKNHNDAPYVFLATNDPRVIRRGERRDITPTLLDRLGVPLEGITPPLDGRPLTKRHKPPRW